jgi:hypothetical protein
MARYSPRDPGFTPVPGVFDALSHIATQGATGFTGVRREEEERRLLAEERAREAEDREIELHEAGVRRGRGPTEPVPPDEDIFAGAEFGMASERTEHEAPSIFRGAGMGMAPSGAPAQDALTQIQMQGAPPEPQILALPGAWVEGLGFTERAITDQDLVQESRRRNAVQRQRPRPGFEQVTEDLYIDRAATPAARAEATAVRGEERGEAREVRGEERETERDRQERARLETALGALQRGEETSPEVLAELVGQVPGSVLFPDEDADNITVMGRDFPNTPEGEVAAIAWREAMAEASRTGATSGDGRITGEVTRRTLARAASTAIDRIRNQVREMNAFERGRLPAGYLEDQIRNTLLLFGFESGDELQQEMRALRLTGVGSGPRPTSSAAGASREPTDEEIAKIIEANPDATDEEIAELIENAGPR